MNFTTIIANLQPGTLVVLAVSAAAILGAVGYAAWGAKKIARFFGPVSLGIKGYSVVRRRADLIRAAGAWSRDRWGR